jgi:hypothetical protein
MGELSWEWRHQMQAFAAGDFRPRIETFVFEKLAHAHCRLNDKIPRNALAGIEIEHQDVCVLNIIYSGRPGVHFHHVHFHEPEKSGQAVDPHAYPFAAFALFDAQLVHGIRNRGQRTFMVEDRAARVPHQLQGAAA